MRARAYMLPSPIARPAFRFRTALYHILMDTDNLTDELGEFLASQGRESAYRVDETLKRSATETTEIVYFTGSNGSELGPFVRKEIELSAGIGMAYDALWRAQRAGARFVHIPRLLDCCVSGDRLTVIMEYIEGETVASLVGRVGASPELACLIMPCICEAVAEFHEAFDPVMVHRDLKPSNIMLTGSLNLTSGRIGEKLVGLSPARVTAVLIDFGIARVHRVDAEADTMKFGTRGYAAPEQFGFDQTDARSDVYALGALTAFCCTGRQPTGKIDKESLVASGASEPLCRVILKAVPLDPNERFASAGAFRTALMGAQGNLDSTFWPQVESRPDFASAMPGNSIGKPNRAPSSSAAKSMQQRGSSRQVRGGSRMLHRSTQIPHAVGRAWNIVLLLVFLILCAAYAAVVMEPTGLNAQEPRWYLFSVVVLLFVPETALSLSLVADRRRWPERLPLIGEPTVGRLCRALLVMLVGGFTVMVVITAFKGM